MESVFGSNDAELSEGDIEGEEEEAENVGKKEQWSGVKKVLSEDGIESVVDGDMVLVFMERLLELASRCKVTQCLTCDETLKIETTFVASAVFLTWVSLDKELVIFFMRLFSDYNKGTVFPYILDFHAGFCRPLYCLNSVKLL